MMRLKLNNYDIIINSNNLDQLNEEIKKHYNKKDIFIVTDENVFDLYKELITKKLVDFNIIFEVIVPGELSKSYESFINVSSNLINKGIKRDNLLIALGGGVVGDLAGFVAGTLYRGIKFIQVPTTLLAMVDSSIGSKTGIDINEGKNLIGVFKDPLFVYIDSVFLNTLSDEEYNNGIAEVIKAGLIKDSELYNFLKHNNKLDDNHLLKAIEVKRKIVISDPFEENERMLLNFGHTFGHAIERKLNYKIKHGVAVSYGMLISIDKGIKLGITNKEIYNDVLNVLLKFNLVKFPLYEVKDLLDFTNTDKKNLSDGLRFIMLEEIGKAVILKGVKFDD